MSKSDGLLIQKSFVYLNQGRTLNNILIRGAHCMTLLWSQQTEFR